MGLYTLPEAPLFHSSTYVADLRQCSIVQRRQQSYVAYSLGSTDETHVGCGYSDLPDDAFSCDCKNLLTHSLKVGDRGTTLSLLTDSTVTARLPS